jgi:hypothetical protein
MAKRKLEEELIDAYIDIINIIEDENVDKSYIESTYKNAKKRCKDLERKELDKKKIIEYFACKKCHKRQPKNDLEECVYCGGDLILKTEKSIHIQMKEKLI